MMMQRHDCSDGKTPNLTSLIPPVCEWGAENADYPDYENRAGLGFPPSQTLKSLSPTSLLLLLSLAGCPCRLWQDDKGAHDACLVSDQIQLLQFHFNNQATKQPSN